jgi:hypothetical protein
VAVLKAKTISKVVIALSLALLLALLANSLRPASGEVVVIEATPSNIPSKVAVLEVILAELTKEQASDIALSIFGVRGEAQQIRGGWMIVEGSKEVRLYRTGGVEFFDNYKMSKGCLTPQKLPAIDECVRIAKELLKKLEAHGLVPKGLEMTFAELANDTIVFAFKNGTRKTFLNNIHVNFALSYNGIPIWGPGAKARVYIGEGGEVVGFIGRFWEVRSAGEVSILRPEEAVQKLKELGYGRSVPREMVSKVIVKSIELVYYAPPPDVEPTQLVPFYVVKGVLVGKDGRIFDFAQAVPAIRS